MLHHYEPALLQAVDALHHRFEKPSEELVLQIMSWLTPKDNHFVTLQRVPDGSRDGTYIHAAVLADGRFTVEYQAGDVQHHHAQVDSARRAHEVVAAWAYERPGWREMLPWGVESFG